MDRRNFLKAVGVSALSMAFSPICKKSMAAPERKPNIILIMADDLGYNDLGCYGSKIVDTPNLDALAKGGMRFTDYHSNGAMCSPTRAALLTGRYQQRAGVESVLSCKSTPHVGIAHKEVTFAEILKGAGYVTAMYGKWHLGFEPKFNPVTQGFDEYIGFTAGGSDYVSHINRSGEPDWWLNDKLKAEEGYTTDLLSDHAVRFVKQNKDKPFCIYVPYQAVHFPFQGPDDPADRVEGGSYWSKAKYGRRYVPIEDRKQAYREMIESMDAGVGRIVKAVKDAGLENDTLIFFTSDNGAYSWVGSNLPCSGQKATLLEGGHRVPAIAYWPGKIKPGTVTDETTMTMDMLPTISSICDAETPKGLKFDGVDISSVLFKGEKLAPRTLFWRTSGAGAVRKGPWKLLITNLKNDKSPSIGLYDLSKDIAENNNLAENKPKMVAKLKADFDAWEKDVTAGVTWIRK